MSHEAIPFAASNRPPTRQRHNHTPALHTTSPFTPPRITHLDAQEVPDLGRGDVGERVVLDQRARAAVDALKGGVDLNHGHGHSGPGALVLALTSDPCLERLELPPEGLDLRGVGGAAAARVM